MFFRREKPRVVTFSDRLDALRQAAFKVDSTSAGTRVSKYGCAAVLTDHGDDVPGVGKTGVLIRDEIALLTNAGFQQFFITPSGKKLPALAPQLHALHNFHEDLKQAIGEISLYNEGLGTTSSRHMYDRVEGRDAGSAR